MRTWKSGASLPQYVKDGVGGVGGRGGGGGGAGVEDLPFGYVGVGAWLR